ncbi:DNA (cytosine-5)-methyltransferase 1 [Bacillus sp. SORGH_AS 510]|uniref:DNA cytosine methyltransferase n=1 Tax=Bacillus sp. SORGH_AS_0510 TaxID=3041771 RepID=UPI0027841465|nr:DNA (cytosine-5-)-methyltransferase [Bacillus sp. SORGH_AS_0510]MDQ1147035.1 DNA (cytosine-5)-methyltransferase 1 [Bacillus sp. SORGH_AS_0510]
MKYKTIDLFAGIGGIRRGFEMTGRFENKLSAEIDKYACKTYMHLYDEDPFNDVTSEEFKTKVENTTYDVLLGGFPCQAFSIAGKKEGFLDQTRGTLFFDIADILNRTRPKAFLLENVEGLLRHKGGQTIQVILDTLVRGLNYHVIGVEQSPVSGEVMFTPNDFLLNSKNFGLPQNRPRVYFMGFDRNYYGDLLNDLPIKELPKSRQKEPIFNDLHDLLDYGNEADFYLAEGYLSSLKKHRDKHKGKGNGFGYIVVNELGIENPISNALLATGGSGKERNLVYDPQEHIGGMVVKGKQTPLNNEGIRLMTPREWGKLQGFIGYAFVEDGIDKFSFPEKMSKIQQYKQFGNSVTIPVIEVLAETMVTILDYLDYELTQIKYSNIREKSQV